MAGTNRRLATGRKVNDALDNARNYFQAQGFMKDSRDLSNLNDEMSLGLQTIQKAQKAIDGISKMVESVQALARSARTLVNTDAVGRDALGTQMAQLLSQVTTLSLDAGFNGRNLIQTGATADVLDVVTNLSTGAAQTKISITAADLRVDQATGLNLSIAGNGFAFAANVTTYAAGNFTGAGGDTKLDALITAATTALTNIQSRASVIATQASTVQIRQQFTKDWSKISNVASDALTLADMNEEGAALTALQTRQQLAVTAMSLASQSDQAILRLF
jgi:flagellin-like hook-associated protein FlgL